MPPRDHRDDGSPFLGCLIGLTLSAPFWVGVAWYLFCR